MSIARIHELLTTAGHSPSEPLVQNAITAIHGVLDELVLAGGAIDIAWRTTLNSECEERFVNAVISIIHTIPAFARQ